MPVKISTFEKDGKSFPTIELRKKENDKFAFSFGLSKARLIMENYDEIRQFVEDHATGN